MHVLLPLPHVSFPFEDDTRATHYRGYLKEENHKALIQKPTVKLSNLC